MVLGTSSEECGHFNGRIIENNNISKMKEIKRDNTAINYVITGTWDTTLLAVILERHK